MNLRNLSDENLHLKTLDLVSEERKLTIEILNHLREIAVRRLYAIMGYSSLWEYCIEELKYSEAAAQRRISAMRLISEIPEIAEKVQAGKLSLSVVSQVQSACKSKPELKKQVLVALEGKSKRQAEVLLASYIPQEVLPEKRRPLDASQAELRFVVSASLEVKLERIKALVSHKMFSPSYAELFELMSDIVLDKIDPERAKTKRGNAPPPPAEVMDRASPLQNLPASPNTPTRYIRVEIKRALFQRARSRCEFVSQTTGRRCEETKSLQIDHIIPFAHGGTSEHENLQLLCGTHNRLRAIQTFGKQKLRPFLSN